MVDHSRRSSMVGVCARLVNVDQRQVSARLVVPDGEDCSWLYRPGRIRGPHSGRGQCAVLVNVDQQVRARRGRDQLPAVNGAGDGRRAAGSWYLAPGAGGCAGESTLVA